MKRLVLISDTHNHRPSLPDGDILLHSGDFTMRGSFEETINAMEWLGVQAAKFEHVIITGGNHDWFFYHLSQQIGVWATRDFVQKHAGPNVVYLENEFWATELEGKVFSVYGSPAQPEFGGMAWNYARGAEIKAVWDKIPANVDMLITHGPPMGVLDWVGKERVGCEELRIAVERIKPRAHVFGHLHSAGGQHRRIGTTDFYNAAVVDESYKLAHASQVIEL